MTSDPSVGLSIENNLENDTDDMILKHSIKETTEFMKGCSV